MLRYTSDMGGSVYELAELNSPEIDSLDRENTLFMMALSPLEVHGPHLPLGTDVRVAEEVRDRAFRKLRERRPELDFVIIPSFFMGSDTIPDSIDVNSRAVYYLLKATAEFLADRGFHYLLVTDNHGGPRHHIAIAKAVRRLYFRRGFHIVAPFLPFFRRMYELDPELVRAAGSGRGACGDIEDSHAGLNETSIMLAIEPEKVGVAWSGLARTALNARAWTALLLGAVGRVLGAMGLHEMAKDVAYVGVVLSWLTEKQPPTYIGEPCAATPEAGERMLDAHTDEAVARVEAALEGRAPYYTPLGWTLRLIEPSR